MDPVDEYIAAASPDKRAGLSKLRDTIRMGIPPGFSEEMNNRMIGYVVPLSTYPAGYHSDSTMPVRFINLAVQKTCILLNHYGLYADAELHAWFVARYMAMGYNHKLDNGQSCIRFKYMDEIPYELIEELAGKITLDAWLRLYRKSL
jgi:uncharacterized protein YdhG (YjbR/CyaY superfamily)